MVRKFLKNKTTSIFLIFLGMCLVLGIVRPNFFKYENLLSVSGVAAYTAIFAFGELLVILEGGIELTIGSTIGLSGVIACMLITKLSMPIPIACLITLLAGALVGAANAFLVNFIGLPPYIATMGMSQVIKSVALLVTDARPVMGVGADYIWIGKGTLLKIPVCVWILIIVAVALGLFLKKTVPGRQLYAIGGNPEAARFSGINVIKLKSFAYITAGCCSALAGIIISAKLGSAQGATGAGYESDAIASTIIGGTSFTGGIGTVFGTVIGACIMAVIRNALVLLAVSPYIQSMIIGLIIIIAVTIDTLRQRSAQKVSKKFIQEALDADNNAEKSQNE